MPLMNGTPQPEHIGDGVYLSDDGYQLWLAANHHENRVVALDPQVFFNLCRLGAERFGYKIQLERDQNV